jgi:hypothetical protein
MAATPVPANLLRRSLIAALVERKAHRLISGGNAILDGVRSKATIFPSSCASRAVPSPIQVAGPLCVALSGRMTCASMPSRSGRPSICTTLDLDVTVRRIGQNWKYVPSSPAGSNPAARARSAIHADARSSSSVPASRPRMASPASVRRSRRMSSVVMASSAGGPTSSRAELVIEPTPAQAATSTPPSVNARGMDVRLVMVTSSPGRLNGSRSMVRPLTNSRSGVALRQLGRARRILHGGDARCAMGAETLVESYWNLQIYDGEWTSRTISINRYKIGFDDGTAAAKGRDAVKAAALKARLDVDQNAFFRARCGKVSPDDCDHILSLAVETKLVKLERLQSWADAHLGVDCTGFAIAYYADQGLADINKYKGGMSCPTFLNKATYLNRASNGGPLIWDLDEVQPDDMILWMHEGKKETQTPGHIAIVYEVDYDAGVIYTCESNQSDDGHGHRGPRYAVRRWKGVKSGWPRYIKLANVDQVLIVRPPPTFG